MLKLILLDRDGVLNKELGGYVTDAAAFEVLPHVVPNLLRLKNMGCRFVVVTNQSGIAKSLYTHNGLDEIHNKLTAELGKNGLQLDEIYYCPHHPDFGLCLCRKPLSGMVEKALARYAVLPGEAVMIGDTMRDVEAAQQAGVQAYKINSNENWAFIVDELEAQFRGKQ